MPIYNTHGHITYIANTHTHHTHEHSLIQTP